MRVTVGGYTVVFEEGTGRLHALRYGEEWRDCVGDKLLLALAYEVESLRDREQKLKAAVLELVSDAEAWRLGLDTRERAKELLK